SRIERVAAQFVARKSCAIEETDARAGTGEKDRRDRARGSCPADNHIIHCQNCRSYSRPNTIALFFEPNPRQLQSAASISAARPVFGMKSRSQSGSGDD